MVHTAFTRPAPVAALLGAVAYDARRAPTDLPRRMIVATILAGLRHDLGVYSPGVALLRAARSTRALAAPGAVRQVLANAAYLSHVTAVAPGDRLGFLAHRSYLAKGLSARQRVACAHRHYTGELARFDVAFHRAVRDGAGLPVWQRQVEGVHYAIHVAVGNDVLYEGGLSMVFSVDGGRVCVLSFSLVDSVSLGLAGGDVLFVARKQLTADHAYQAAFNDAFDRTTPAHLCIAAVGAVAEALGHCRLATIVPERHPGWEPVDAERFDTAYRKFWASLGGIECSTVAFEVPVPFAQTPLDELAGKARKRAQLRRRHMVDVADATVAAIRSRLQAASLEPSGGEHLEARRHDGA